MKRLLVTMAALLLIAATVLLLRQFSLTTGVCGLCKAVFVLAGPPADYYEPLAVTPIPGVDKPSVVLVAQPKYHGMYAVEIAVPLSQHLPTGRQYRATCNSGRLDSSGALSENVMAQTYRGVVAFVFYFPRDLDESGSLACDIELEGRWPDSAFVQLSKYSDL